MPVGRIETEQDLLNFLRLHGIDSGDTRIRQLQGGAGGGGPPTGPAGGVLAGSYPNPTFADDMATQAELDAAIAGVSTGGGRYSTHAKFGDG